MSDHDFVERFPSTHAVIQAGIERQMHTGCQIYVSCSGAIVADCGIGHSNPGQPMTADTINLWLSAGKPLTAVAILQQWDLGRLELDDRVSRFIPEFAAAGKASLTVRHLLTHTGGFRTADTGWPDVPWDETIRRICTAEIEPNWIVGRTAGYHTTTSWFILGEILSRLTGQSYPDAIRDNLLAPLGCVDTSAALTPTQYAQMENRIGPLFSRERGELQLLDWNTAARCAMPSPGSHTRGPIRDLGRFYEMLLNGGELTGHRILSSQAVAAMTARHRVGQMDLTLAHVVDFGLGVIVDSNLYGVDTVPYGYGRFCSPRTFGHGGAQSSQGWCDPECELVVAYYFNGRPGEGQHNRRTRQFNEAIYNDLNLPQG